MIYGTAGATGEEKKKEKRKMEFALVSWAKGEDKDALSIVPWILDFDAEKLNSQKEYLVECCIMGEKPANGWPVEPASILQLAGKCSA